MKYFEELCTNQPVYVHSKFFITHLTILIPAVVSSIFQCLEDINLKKWWDLFNPQLPTLDLLFSQKCEKTSSIDDENEAIKICFISLENFEGIENLF